jgi:hypothetical protein
VGAKITGSMRYLTFKYRPQMRKKASHRQNKKKRKPTVECEWVHLMPDFGCIDTVTGDSFTVAFHSDIFTVTASKNV